MKPVLVIAEAGVNHNGDIDIAKKLIEVAAHAGADMVKFQTFSADKLAAKNAAKASYQADNTGAGSQYDMLKQLELSHEDHLLLQAHAKLFNIAFFSTAFDTEGLDYLNSLGFDRFKVPSGEITNYPYLQKLAHFGKPIILSTGMANMEEIGAAIEVLTSNGLTKSDLTVLHCNTAYPTPLEDVNLLAMNTIGNTFDVSVGYSDHTPGIEVSLAAVALGAVVIEKHFTLDKTMDGPDHKASLEPDELHRMISGIRAVSAAISGNAKKVPSNSERQNTDIARKSIHTARALKAGDVLSESDLIPLRPGHGLSPMRWNEVVGKVLQRDIDAFEMIRESDFA